MDYRDDTLNDQTTSPDGMILLQDPQVEAIYSLQSDCLPRSRIHAFASSMCVRYREMNN